MYAASAQSTRANVRQARAKALKLAQEQDLECVGRVWGTHCLLGVLLAGKRHHSKAGIRRGQEKPAQRQKTLGWSILAEARSLRCDYPKSHDHAKDYENRLVCVEREVKPNQSPEHDACDHMRSKQLLDCRN